MYLTQWFWNRYRDKQAKNSRKLLAKSEIGGKRGYRGRGRIRKTYTARY